MVTDLVPIMRTELEEFVPTAQEAIERIQGRDAWSMTRSRRAGPTLTTMS
jgi:hypothetical protein